MGGEQGRCYPERDFGDIAGQVSIRLAHLMSTLPWEPALAGGKTSERIHFGTDGWRGRIAEDYTFGAVRRCAQGFATFLLSTQGNARPVVVGYDRRFASEHFAEAVAEVLAGNGLHVLLTQEATPTPVIAHAVVHRRAVGAVNITASHNPAWDNGFKVRDHRGGAVDPAGLKEIEQAIPADESAVRRMPLSRAIDEGLVEPIDPSGPYIEQLEKMVDLPTLRRSGLRVVVDVMWGNGASWLPRLLDGGSTRVIEIHSERNPIFPQMTRPEPIPPNIDVGLERTTAEAADALLVTDGDADRVGLGDEHGRFVDQLRVYGLLAHYLLEVRGLRGPIVKTLSTTSMLEKLGKLYQVPVFETGVGFKYVAPKMLEVDALIGGEESGGYAFRGHVPERDGILAGLFLLDAMVRQECKPSQLVEKLFAIVGPHYYERIDSPLVPEDRPARQQAILSAQPESFGGLRVTGLKTLDGFKYSLEDGGWVLIRFSGTEPIVRVYCETTRQDRVQDILQDGLRLAGVR
ncbi:MAG: phosphoglucomutase/phosphomannomutase family protein [Chloroflexota bacterium]